MTLLSMLSINQNGMGRGRGLSRVWPGHSARFICIIHPTDWMMGCMNQASMLNSYNQLYNWLDICSHDTTGCRTSLTTGCIV